MKDYKEIQLIVPQDKTQRIREMFLKYELETKGPSAIVELEKLCNNGKNKINKLIQLAKEMVEKKEKIVIFTRYESTASYLKSLFVSYGFEKELGLLTTLIPKNVRSEMVELFNEKSQAKILIITDALNVGINLNNANALIHYDYPDSPLILAQRNNRILSVGNNEPKNIYCLMTEDGVDQKKFLILKKQEQTISHLFSEE